MSKKIEKASKKITHWIGSTQSIIIHTIFFVIIFALRLFGVSSSDILLVLTTAVSLEAIYLAIFIQMTINRQSKELEEVSEDIEEIQEDVDEIQKDVDEIQEDIEDIEEDEQDEEKMLEKIEDTLGKLIEEVVELKQHQHQNVNKIKK